MRDYLNVHAFIVQQIKLCKPMKRVAFGKKTIQG